MSNKLQLKRGLKSALPKLSAGEPAYTTDTYELFIGNGSSNVNLSGGKWYNGTQMNGTSTTAGAYYYSACPLVKVGDMYLNTSNGNVYECTTAGSGSSAKWTYRGCLKGVKGDTGQQGATGVAGADGKNGTNGTNGKDGAAATITIGTVTTGSAGSAAKVVNSGTSNAAKLDFTIPRGATGAQGATGSTGAKGDKGERGANATIVVAASDSSAKSKAAADYTCTGSSDQSTINSAISALPSGGGKIVLLEGTYNISGTITVNKDNVTIEGMGAGTVLKRMFNDSTSNEWIGGIIYADTHKNIIISDISFDGNQSSYTGQYNGSIKFSNASHCIIKNTYHSNVRGTAIAIFGGCSENNVVNNIVQSSLRCGIHLYYATNNIIQGNMVMNTEKGVVLEYYANNNKISGNYIMRGTGTSGDYTTSQYTIQIANGTYNDVSDNYIMGKSYVNNGGNTNTFKNNVRTASHNVESDNLSECVGGADNTASGEYAVVAGGHDNTASAADSFIGGGSNNKTTGDAGFVAGGAYNEATGANSFVTGANNKALTHQAKFGHYAIDGTAGSASGTTGDAFVIGNGSSSSKSNAFRVSYAGAVYGKSAFNSTGADYAEFFEWLDGNPDNADRRGLFVTLDGDKIRIANADDDYILGAISAAPGVIGNNHADTWQGMWLTDIFGEVLTHTIHHEAQYDDEDNLIHDAYDAVEPIVNPDYNPDEKYIPREERKEWGVVGMMGQLVVIDDGTCKVNGNCTVSDGGTATASESGYRVIARLDDTHVKVLFR